MHYSTFRLIFILFFCSSFNLNAQDTIVAKSIFKHPKTKYIGLGGAFYGIVGDNLNRQVYAPMLVVSGGYALKNSKIYLGGEYQHLSIWEKPYSGIKNYFFLGPSFRYRLGGKNYNFYAQTGYRLSNYFVSASQGLLDKTAHYANLGVGVSFKYKPNLYINWSRLFLLSLQKDNKSWGIDKRFGIEYYFNKNHKDIALPIDKAKDKTGKRLVMTSLAYMPFDSLDFEGGYKMLKNEIKIGYYIDNNISLGAYTSFVRGKPTYSEAEWFYYLGPFVNAKLFARKRLSAYLETSYLISNFLLVNTDNTLPKKGYAEYLQLGWGLNYRINPKLYFDIGLYSGTCVTSRANCKGGNEGGYRVGIEYVGF